VQAVAEYGYAERQQQAIFSHSGVGRGAGARFDFNISSNATYLERRLIEHLDHDRPTT
jgi:hypothetical protein